MFFESMLLLLVFPLWDSGGAACVPNSSAGTHSLVPSLPTDRHRTGQSMSLRVLVWLAYLR
jgi:hypothetical protein